MHCKRYTVPSGRSVNGETSLCSCGRDTRNQQSSISHCGLQMLATWDGRWFYDGMHCSYSNSRFLGIPWLLKWRSNARLEHVKPPNLSTVQHCVTVTSFGVGASSSIVTLSTSV